MPQTPTPEITNPEYPHTRQIPLRFQLIVFSIARTIVNTGYRMVYPFLPFIAAGLGVPVEAISQAIVVRSLVSMSAPLLGAVAHRLGSRRAILIGLGIFAGAGLTVSALPTYPALFVGIILMAVGKIIVDPAMYSYIGERVSYRQRGLAVAVTELGWSGAFLIGIPLAGALIARGGWSAPFPWIALCALIMGALLWRIIPPDHHHTHLRPSMWGSLRALITHPSALAALAMGLSISAANETVNVVFGVWMRDTFLLQVAAVGAASTVIGIAELGGEGLVAGLADRVGKRRAVIVGALLNAAVNLLLPVLGRTFTGALIGLFLFFITFEFALVSSLPLMTEVLPEARATLMAANVSALQAGRAIGAFIGPLLFASFGLMGNGIAAMGFNLLAVGLLIALVRQD